MKSFRRHVSEIDLDKTEFVFDRSEHDEYDIECRRPVRSSKYSHNWRTVFVCKKCGFEHQLESYSDLACPRCGK
jgi:rubrerythrin